MKKMILCLAVLAGGFTAVVANDLVVLSAVNNVVVAGNEEFQAIEFKDLNETVQKAIVTLAGDAYDVKKLEFDKTKELTRVTLQEKGTETQKVVVLDKEGKEVTE